MPITRAEALAELARRGVKLPAPTPRLSAQDQKQLAAAREGASLGLDIATKAEQFVDTNKKAGTGGVLGLNFPGGLGGVSEIAAPFSEDLAEMQSLTNQMAPALRAPGSGAMSDKDVALFKRSVPNVDFPGPTNQAIQRRLKDESARKAAYASFLDTWAQKRGTLQGADAAFLKYWSQRNLKNQQSQAKPGEKSAYRILAVE